MDYVRRQDGSVAPTASALVSSSSVPASSSSSLDPALVSSSLNPALVSPSLDPALIPSSLVPTSSTQAALIPGMNSGSSASVTPQTSKGHDTTVPSSTSSVVAPVSKGGLSEGAVAGVAISMLLAGVLIAGAIFFLLLRRQKKGQYAAAAYTMQHLPYNGATKSSEKGPTVVASAIPSSIDDLLPQPAADDTITDEVSKLRDNIKNHVRTYYHSTPVSAGSINETGLRDLATATGVSPPMLRNAMSNPSTRQDTLRLVLAWVVLSRSTGQRDASLLPVDLARLATSIVGRDGSNTTNLTLYSKWKVITGAMLQQRSGKNAQDPSRAQTFANTVTELDSVFAPFIQGSMDGGQRRKNLDMILTRAANFAFLLFTQPGSFHFDFSSGVGGLVAFPALVQTIDDQGQVSRPARVLIEKEVAV